MASAPEMRRLRCEVATPRLRTAAPVVTVAFLLVLAGNSCSVPPTPEMLAGGPDRTDTTGKSSANVEVGETDSYWTSMGGAFNIHVGVENYSGNGLFVITGKLTNTSKSSIRRVELEFELLGADGEVVYAERGVNRLAEDDIMLDDDEIAAQSDSEAASLAPGAEDDFRMIFIGGEIPVFVGTRVSVISAR